MINHLFNHSKSKFRTYVNFFCVYLKLEKSDIILISNLYLTNLVLNGYFSYTNTSLHFSRPLLTPQRRVEHLDTVCNAMMFANHNHGRLLTSLKEAAP